MSVPAGTVDGLPVGLHLVGNYWSEARLLNVAHRLQMETDWHRQIPEAFE
jgi:aspartyl-tRNA(Asn)/glutamyl-tRNA(Gln) amidotransferase subunit A